MIRIEKGKEPRSLTEYKMQENASFQDLPINVKNDIRLHLLKEQGYLCAYCMRRIHQDSMKIEHFMPQSTISGKEALEYNNLLGVCWGGSKHKKRDSNCDSQKNDDPRELTCDSKKGNTRIIADPRDQRVIDKIEYKHDGTIYSKDDKINADLNVALNLNSMDHALPGNRRAAYRRVMKEIKSDKTNSFQDASIRKVIRKYSTFQPNGETKLALVAD